MSAVDTEPRDPKPKLAVVLLNLGGPDSLKAVRPFLFNLFRDPAILALPAIARVPLAALIATTRRKEASANYAHMGGSSPLLRETQAQAHALAARLEDEQADFTARVFIAMRYWRPFTRETARAVAAFRPDKVVLLPLYPQFSTTTTGSSLAAWKAAYKGPGQVCAACCYFDENGFVDAHVKAIRDTFDAAGCPTNLRLLFSAHGLPERVIEAGDPYQWQIEQTCAAVARKLGPQWDWQVCYQSRVGPLKWIGPSTPDAVNAAGVAGKGVLITPIAFVSEHVETLVELDRDYRRVAQAAGCPVYMRAPAIGVQASFIDGLARTVMKTLDNPSGSPRPGAAACKTACGRCPYQQVEAVAA